MMPYPVQRAQDSRWAANRTPTPPSPLSVCVMDVFLWLKSSERDVCQNGQLSFPIDSYASRMLNYRF